MKKTILCLLPIVLVLGCHQRHHSTGSEATVKVVRESLQNPLFFSGTLQPLKVVNVPAPADGFVTEKKFEYGQPVKKGEVVLSINSEQLQKDYSAALTAYLKSKQELASSRAKLHADSELLKLGIIAKEAYLQTKSAFDNDQVSYLQAVNAVKETLKNGGGNFADIENLDISNIGAVDKALRVSYARLQIKALSDGIALIPPQASSSDEDKKLMIGTKVETGQVLLSIGDLSGLSVVINVGENDVDKVQPGTKVSVSGSAFPDKVLSGFVQSIDAEARQENSYGPNNIPQFSAKIVVPNLDKAALAQVRVGMSAKIELAQSEAAKLVLPITAVHESGGRHFVNRLDHGKVQAVTVNIGSASENKVQILSGLREGDNVMLSDSETA